MKMSDKLQKLIKSQYLILDGAMGTELQKLDVSKKSWDYDNKNLEGCNEILCKTDSDIIENVHLDYLNAGVNIVTTNSFGNIPWVLSEYEIENKVEELCIASVNCAKSAIKKYRDSSSSDREIFIAGSLGPGTKLPSLGQISFDEMYEGYRIAIKALIDSGIDILLFETSQDVLQLKAAIIAARSIDENIPIMISVTIEKEGAMLLGTDIETACVILSSMPIFSLGLNCGTGPDISLRHAAKLSKLTNLPISMHANAGLPQNVDGKAHYSMTPEEFAEINLEASKLDGVAILGGCCGSGPSHIKALSEILKGKTPKPPVNNHTPKSIASLFSYSLLKQEPAPLLVGERSNATGCKVFREMMFANDLDGILGLGFEQVKLGSHAIDLNVAWAGREEKEDMAIIAELYAKQITVPLVIDTTKPEVMEVALKKYGGKAILNSANFEQGEERFDTICLLAKKYGAALVCLTIDEKGMATTSDRKFEIAKRMYKRATEMHGIEPHNIIFDPLTFTVASGEEASFDLAIETLNGIKKISSEFSEASITLGLSNISFGLKPQLRRILNSVFLNECIKYGLTQAIVHVGSILPFTKISEKEKELSLDLIYNKTRTKDPLLAYINYFEVKKEASDIPEVIIKQPLPLAIKTAMLDGEWKEMSNLLIEAKTYKDFGGEHDFADHILNKILLPTMQEIGVLFGSGKMQLPFVLGSAEVMKKSVDFLSNYMSQKKANKSATIILGTVAGDVHDVGKNLVDILLSNNGFNVINIGTKASIEHFIEEYKKHNADFIGMSGLLVKSTEIMKDNLSVLKSMNIEVPVLLGGAALTREFVEKNCKEVYGDLSDVFYCRDGFDAIDVMKKIIMAS